MFRSPPCSVDCSNYAVVLDSLVVAQNNTIAVLAAQLDQITRSNAFAAPSGGTTAPSCVEYVTQNAFDVLQAQVEALSEANSKFAQSLGPSIDASFQDRLPPKLEGFAKSLC